MGTTLETPENLRRR